ncbi:AraC family transcriptional regulator [Pseudomaricurvus alkylphenolicus]|uniref:AraC-like transcriptional regulator QhpR n=1 Tax=Pseudomaricurvus alkylphenolicus TaxID=1306991 RepID=UPI001420226A|nr:AraC family transcriptional regulator [Pseudomaricurvus alkylphenolicus]NIB38783.1 AraC family transcriptional regulator [Pseudomaricurvus alkylphenolicus]
MTVEPEFSLHQPCINSVFASLLFDYMEKVANADVDAFLASLQLKRKEIEAQEQISMANFLLLMEEGAKYLHDPDLGLHYYEKLDYRHLGVLGYALINSKTLGDALNMVMRYYCLFQNDMEHALATTATKAILSYRVTNKNLPPSRQDSEMTLMASLIFIRDCIDSDWRPDEAYFQHPAPEDLSEHKRLICDNLHFNHHANQLVFDKSCLDLAVKNADELLSQSLLSTLEELLKLRQQPSDKNWLNAMQNQIAEQLSEGVPAIEEIAEHMNMSRRTLQRKLSQEGITFKGLVEQIRRELGKNYLSVSNMPLQDIAFLLGYSDIAAFNRAFKRWEKVSPSEYRMQHQTHL